jgi:hypothetical protein
MTDFSEAAPAAGLRPRWTRWVERLSWAAIATIVVVFSCRKLAEFYAVKVPSWQQLVPIGLEVRALELAEDGDVYLAGTFEGTLHLGKAALTSVGATDIFVTRFDVATGTFSWVQQAGGAGKDVVSALVVHDNHLYLAGQVGGRNAGPALLASFEALALPAKGITSMFVARLDEQQGFARFSWVQGLPDVYASEVQRLAVQGTTLYVAGYVEASAGYFGLNNPQLPDTTRYHHASYLARLTDDGATAEGLAMHFIGLDKQGYITGLVAGAYPAVYLAGNFEKEPAASLPTAPDKPAADTASHLEAQLHKYVGAGPILRPCWNYTLGDAGENTVNGLAVKGARLYGAGSFLKTTRFKNLTLTTPVQAGYLVCLLDSANGANPLWATALTGLANRASRYRATSVALLDSAVYVAGSYESLQLDGTEYFDHQPTLEEQFVRLAQYNRAAIFVSQVLDKGSEGQLRWQQVTTGSSMAHVATIAASKGRVYVAGGFQPAVEFGRFRFAGWRSGITGFWAELGPDKHKDQQMVELGE